MRVCIATRGDLFPANHGAAVKIVRTAESLSMEGAEVFVVTDRRDACLRWRAGEVEEVPYGDRGRGLQELPGFAAAGRLAERFCRLLGYPEEETFLYRPLADPAWWARVLYVGVREGCRVFQAEFPGYGLACAAAARLVRGRSLVVEHNVEWDRLEQTAGLPGSTVSRLRDLELGVLGAVDDVVAVSGPDRDRLVAAGVDPGRVTIIPHGVDVASYERAGGDRVRFAWGLDADAPLLFFHGTLHYEPNARAVRFIAEDLLPRLLPRRPDLKVLVAGVNPPAYYDHPAIRFTGPVEDLPGHIAAADVAVCPLDSGGGTRMKILEYFAAGLPCVSTAKGAEGIACRDGEEIVIADDPDRMAREVLALIDDPDRRRRMGEAARRFARFHDWGEVARRYLALYRGEGRGEDHLASMARRARAVAPPPAPLRPPRRRPAIEAHLPPREPSKPLTLLLLVNRGCNLRCSFCDLWDRPEQLPLQQGVDLMGEAERIGTRTVVLTGGEPFLHRDLFRLARAARERGMGVNITTNGTLLERRWDELVDGAVDSVSVSIDGLEATHDRLRGQRGCHRRAMAGIERVAADGRLGLSIYFTVNRLNVRELVPVWEMARRLGAGFDFWPVNDAEDLYLRSPEDMAAWREAVAHIAAHDPEVARRRHFYEQGLAYHAGAAGPLRCLGLVDQYGVTYRGDLLPCCVWGAASELAVGNVFQTPLSELWRSEAVQAARRGLYERGCTAGCFNHSLYEFTRSTGESFRVDWRPGMALG